MDAGIPYQMVNLITQCIETTSQRVLWNESPSSSFTPSRGIRQGDPLSPNIFVLCLERLSQLISKEVVAGLCKAFKFGRTSINVSHLCFADDMLLFAEATNGLIERILQYLRVLCVSSD